jgi:hypothetical protein
LGLVNQPSFTGLGATTDSGKYFPMLPAMNFRISSFLFSFFFFQIIMQGLYARTFNCNLEEALDGNLENYSCLAEFFRRKLKSGVRPIEPASSVVAPSDGTVLNFGRVTAGEFCRIITVSICFCINN